MGRPIPFSDADFSVSAVAPYRRACLVDTNFLIALAYEPHKFHEEAQGFFEILGREKVAVYISLSTRSEFLDFERRVIVTEQMLGMLADNSTWKITRETRQKLHAQKTWVDQQAGRSDLPVLTDGRIKEVKKLFSPMKASGHDGWLDFCNYYLTGLLDRWEKAADAWGLNYVGTRETENSDLFQKKVRWENLYTLSAKTCLGSFDAMLLNMFLSSNFRWMVSLDYDLAYGMMAESDSRSVLIPDSLYRNQFKKMRF